MKSEGHISMTLFRGFSVLAISVTYGCRKPYTAPAILANNNYLVVEGVINAGADSTFIKLSRTVRLSSKVTANPVLNAIVTVESDQNATYPLTETINGYYVSAGLNLDNTRKYRLRIKTSDDKEYLSDLIAVVNSPPIDSVNYSVDPNNGVTIYVNTHDPQNNTHYYRWEYQEAWIIRSHYYSKYKSNGDTILPRDQVHDNIYQCWQSDSSSTIVLGTSAKLKNDVIFRNPMVFISATSEKFTSEYSILVKQYALTSEAFSFWQSLKKNTEKIGSIFDAQPSEIQGNIHSITNPSEPVLGYLSIGSTTSQRIFIRQRVLPAWEPTPVYAYCQLVPACCYYQFTTPRGQIIDQVNLYMNPADNPYYIPIDAIRPPGAPPIGYTTTSVPICVDCTTRGTNKQPNYWQF